MKILFGHHGRFGDLFINLPAIKALSLTYEGCLIDMPVHKDYAEAIPLLMNLPYLNGIFITNEYEKFPNQRDVDNLRGRDYDEIFNPMQRAFSDDWWKTYHQTQRVGLDYRFNSTAMSNISKKIELNKWFDVPNKENFVALAPFPAWYEGANNPKALTVERAQEIVNFILSKGYQVLQVGHPDEPKIEGTIRLQTSYFESVKNVLGCKMMIMGDSGLNWVLSGYNFPVLGLYGHRYYGGENVKNIQPVNPNGIYLDASHVNEIPMEKILGVLEEKLK